LKYQRFLSSDWKDKRNNEIWVFGIKLNSFNLILKIKMLKNIGSSNALRLSKFIIILTLIHYYFIMDIIFYRKNYDIIFIEFGRNYDFIANTMTNNHRIILLQILLTFIIEMSWKVDMYHCINSAFFKKSRFSIPDFKKIPMQALIKSFIGLKWIRLGL